MAGVVKTTSLVLKSLFYQGNFNTDNMQGTGFAWLARPVLKKNGITLSDDEDKELSGYFNTNPSFITLIIGIFIKEQLRGDKAFMAKNIYSSAFAALGDSFFWHALRPLLFMISIFVCVNITPWGIALYPLIYGSFHLMFLGTGWLAGGLFGLDTINLFNRFHFKYWADVMDKASVFILGALIVQGIKFISGYHTFAVTGTAVAGFAAGMFIYLKIRRTLMIYIFITFALAALLFVGGYNIWITP